MDNDKAGKARPVGNLRKQGQQMNGMDDANLQRQYRLIVDTASEGIWVLDQDYRTTYVNKRMAEMLGYEAAELAGKSFAFFFFNEDLADFHEKAAMRRKGIAGRYERRLRRRDGTTLWVLVSATPMMDENNLFQGSFAMFTDISERKGAEEALIQSETTYRSIFENAVEGIFRSTPEGRLITVNPAMANIFGYESPEEMISKVASIGHQLYANTEDRHRFRQLLDDDGMTGGFVTQFRRKDGSTLWGSLKVRASKDRAEKILYYEGILEDITARKWAEEELKKSEEKYRNIFENAVEGIFQATADGRYMSVNPALARIHGYSSPEEMMVAVTDIAHQVYVDPGRRAELMRLMREQGYVKDFETMMRRKDGVLQWVSITSHAIRGTDGEVLYHEGCLEDITLRRLGDAELKQLRKTAEGIIQAIAEAVESRDPGISGHHRRTARLARAIAEELGLPHDLVESIRLASLLHDIGKISVPGEILNKPAPLTAAEYELIKGHPRWGYELLRGAELPYPTVEILLQHHERLNGSGYPEGLKGRDILVESRILAVADVVEAMASSRHYRPTPGLDAALGEMRKNRGILYDANAVDACLRLFSEKGFVIEGAKDQKKRLSRKTGSAR
jgi:PAS domain S-box-containing protein/putative nucleotidyltransferase with HDIG domain